MPGASMTPWGLWRLRMEWGGVQTAWEPAEPSRGQEAAPPRLPDRPGPRLSHGVPLVTGLPKAPAQGKACEPWEAGCVPPSLQWVGVGSDYAEPSSAPQHCQVCRASQHTRAQLSGACLSALSASALVSPPPCSCDSVGPPELTPPRSVRP